MSANKYKSYSLVLLGLIAGMLLSLGITAAAQKDEPLPLKSLQQFANVYGAIKSSFVEPVADKDLMDDAIKGLFLDLDPHSSYLDEEAYSQMQNITRGGFGGLGIEIGTQDGMPKVIAPIEDTPAARAGIITGDLITHIDNEPTKGLSLSEAVKKMRGEPGTSIDLTVERPGTTEPLKFHIVRENIKDKSVRGKMLDGGLAYVRISQFQEPTTSDLIKQLKEFSTTPKGLVLDLRNNPGGLLNSAIGVPSVFLPAGKLVVSTKGRIPSSNEEFYSRDLNSFGSRLPDWTKNVPIIVLVNIGSASASEIVAGALQDHKRAKVMGNTTFGKGSVQSILQLSDDTGIKLTTARYYTPSGKSIQNTGVEPDYTVFDSAAGNLFRMQREVDLKHHLVTQESDVDAAEDDDNFVDGEIKMFEMGGADDWQLQQAINALTGKKVLKADPDLYKNKSESPKTEKKTLSNYDPNNVERYKITPEGVIKQK